MENTKIIVQNVGNWLRGNNTWVCSDMVITELRRASRNVVKPATHLAKFPSADCCGINPAIHNDVARALLGANTHARRCGV
jgi:hypothetical protein